MRQMSLVEEIIGEILARAEHGMVTIEFAMNGVWINMNTVFPRLSQEDEIYLLEKLEDYGRLRKVGGMYVFEKDAEDEEEEEGCDWYW